MAKVSVQLKVASMRIATYHTTKALTEDVNMNSRQRYKAKRAAENRERNLYLTKIDKAYTKLSMGLSGCSERTVKALSLPTPRAAKELEVEVKRSNHRIWYKDTNPFGSKIHAVQKSRGKSIPLI